MDNQRGIKAKAAALVWLAASSEAFMIANNVGALHARARPAGSFAASARALAANPARVARTPVMKSGESFSPVKTLAAVLSATTLALNSGAALAADAPPLMQSRSVQGVDEVRYSDFIQQVEDDQIEKVSFSYDGKRLMAVDTDGVRIRMEAIPNDPELLSILTKHKVDVTVMPNQQGGGGGGGGIGQFGSLLFPALLFGGILFLSRRAGGGGQGGGGGGGGMGGGNPMDFSRSQSKVMVNPDTGVTFDQVAGCDQAKLELEEVVDFLKNPTKYTDLGAKIPKGVILEGPPGTGKTMLARAVAGEAGVPFITTSGSEFVEMFVGVGASRVRDLFGKAKDNAPCIVFIDEIDAVGRQRGNGMMGGNDEREQTLNQMLTEMDGFEGNSGIITLAATNRMDVLDNALTRPGRFDRKVTVDLPNLAGRAAILRVHSRGKPLATDVDIDGIARRTPGFSGAQLQNLMNEAAIFAARKRKEVPLIEWDDVDSAIDRLLVGLEKKGGTQDELQQEIVAYHEAGHAIIGALMPEYDTVQKVTIIPRTNGAGGLTFFSPSEARLESGLYSKQYLEAQLSVALGGRLAEEIVYGEEGVTTGASNDFEQVSNIAKRMVCSWGMSDVVGPIDLIGDGSEESSMDWGYEMYQRVDTEVSRLVTNAYARGKKVLLENRDLLDALAERLIERDSVTSEELSMMLVEFDAKAAPYDEFDETKENAYDSLPFTDPSKRFVLPGTLLKKNLEDPSTYIEA